MATNMTRTLENLRRVKSPAADDARWAAVIARDLAVDGKFYYSVATIGVYCRLSCPTRLARRANVSFYANPCRSGGGGLPALQTL
jgi:AraC family transcriptional regulator, regulatory protein of adaptative response / methylated-DNA-[protein]-cysteine methyltransferase